MDLNIVILLILSAIASGSLSYFQYFYKKELNSALILPSIFRFLSLFGLLVLLINPKYETRQYTVVKPGLLVALDGSKSIQLAGADTVASNVMARLRDDVDLADRFDPDYFIFGQSLRLLDSLSYSDTQTDIDQALKQLDELSASKTAPIVLVSDGVQTYGKNYAYTRTGQKVFPVIVGDTIGKSNLEISLVNANSYASLGNAFEAEVFVNYSGTAPVNSELIIEHKGDIIAQKAIGFSEANRSQKVKFEIQAAEEGRQLYKARINPAIDEKEVLDNQRFFEVEVMDEKTEIAVVFSFPHPDLGMIRQSLENLEKKSVDLIPISEWDDQVEEYSVYVVYQPDARFKELFSYLDKTKRNYLLVTGASTDWSFLSQVVPQMEKEYSSLTEEFFPVFAEDFQSFYAEDIGFSEFPSLTSTLGSVRFNVRHSPILRQAINGIRTEQPLMTAFEVEEGRRIVLFGENIWKWRLYAYQRDNEFQRFDRFMGSIFQYLQLSANNRELELIYEKSAYDDQDISIKARKYDSNLNLDLSSALELRIDQGQKAYPMFVNRSFYEVLLPDLEPGEHSFEVKDLSSGAIRKGRFEVLPYSAEQMKSTADVAGLKYLAEQSNGQVFYPSQTRELKQALLEDPDFKPVERVERKKISLIDQKWLLALIVLSLSLEWIIRKYRGLI